MIPGELGHEQLVPEGAAVFFLQGQYGCLLLGWSTCPCVLNCLSASELAAPKYVGNVGGRRFYDCSCAETEGPEVAVLNDP